MNESLIKQLTIEDFFSKENWKINLFYSNLNFRLFALPIIKDWLKVDKIISIEDLPDEIYKDLDMKSGIDFYASNPTGLIWLATRMQWDGIDVIKKHYKESFPYDTFTIRKNTVYGGKTEFYKRKEAKEKNLARPNYVIHGYVTKIIDGELLSLGMCKQDDLIDYVLKYPDELIIRKDDNEFLGIDWFKFKEKYEIKILFDINHPIWKYVKPGDYSPKKNSNFGESYFAYKYDLLLIMQFIEKTENKKCGVSYLCDTLSHISNLQGKIGELERLNLLKFDSSKESVSIKTYTQKVIG